MSKTTESEPESLFLERVEPAEQYVEVHFLDLLIVLAKRKWFIAKLTAGVAVLSLIVSILLPKYFTGTTRILPPQQTQSVAAAMLGQLGAVANLAGKDIGLRNPNDLYVAMLKSRTVADSLIQQFHLQNVYQVKRLMDARERLEQSTEIDSGKDGVITISVLDRDPSRAADLANGYVKELYKLTQSLAVTEAGQRRLFFEGQLHAATEDLARAEQALRVTQEKTGLVQLDGQAKAIIEAMSKARAQIAAKQVQIEAMKSYATPQNPDLLLATKELEAMRGQLAVMEKSQMGPGGDLQLPAGKLPSAGLEYVRAYREFKYREGVFELLSKEFEIAKIDEAKSAPIIQVMDPAIPPEAKSKPKRAVIVIVVTFIGFFVAIVLAFLMEATEYLSMQPQISQRWLVFRRYLTANPKLQ